jgi:predicted RNase H-like nuclease
VRYIGVDGCTGGWFAAVLDDAGLETARYGSFEEVWADHAGAERILVDVPIGLLDDARRPCDTAATERLGCRGSSVFYAPSRPVVELAKEEREVSHAEASETQREATGNGLSRQAWNITGKIAEVDAFLDAHAPGIVHESHPELCFYGFADRPMAYGKTTERGRTVRLAVLEEVLPGARASYEAAVARHPRSEVKRDDVVDALVLAAAACGELVSVPGDGDARTTGDDGREMVIHHPPSRWER